MAKRDLPKSKINLKNLRKAFTVFGFVSRGNKWLFLLGLIFLSGTAITSILFPKLTGDLINAKDLSLEKINHHGQRASSIVKGMLEHSRTGSKEKQPVDINALADEYLRLAYHGLRAKDKSFNADFRLDIEDALPKIKVVPQDIGRVFLNLINNAFYAASTRAQKDANSNFKALVTISAGIVEKKVEIKVKDNGPGIPDEIKEKIFQPFFTTKPTGQGTGLGLSLSYDIIKAHGGDISVETLINDGTTFKILLPTTDL